MAAVADSLHERTGDKPVFLNEFGKLASTSGPFGSRKLPERIADVLG